MADALEQMVDGFQAGLKDAPWELIRDLAPEQAYEYGRAAARAAVAPIAWAQVLGDRLDTTEVCRLLGVSRQAINKRIAAGSLIGLRATGTTHFPSWQFDQERHTVRPEVRDITLPFLEELGAIDPFVVASWANTQQGEDLDGFTPAEWIVAGKDREQLLEAARRAAARLAV